MHIEDATFQPTWSCASRSYLCSTFSWLDTLAPIRYDPARLSWPVLKVVCFVWMNDVANGINERT